MSRTYRVSFRRTEYSDAYVDVEADSEREAKKAAHEENSEGHLDWEYSDSDEEITEVECIDEGEDVEDDGEDEEACRSCGDVEQLCEECHKCSYCCAGDGCNQHPNASKASNYKKVAVDADGFREGGL